MEQFFILIFVAQLQLHEISWRFLKVVTDRTGFLQPEALPFWGFSWGDRRNEKIALHFMVKEGNPSIEDLATIVIPEFEKTFKMIGCIFIIDVSYFESDKIDSNPTSDEQTVAFVFSPKREGWFYAEMAKAEMSMFRQYQPDIPYVIALVNQQTPNAIPADKLHEFLEIPPHIKFIPYNDESDSKTIVLELLKISPTSSEQLKHLIEKN